MRYITAFLFLLTLPDSVSAQRLAVAFRDGNKWGYADTLGNIIIAPLYDQVSHAVVPSDRLLVSKDGKWGLVSEKGKVVIPLKHDQVRFIDDRYVLAEDNSTEGTLRSLYSATGRMLLRPERQVIYATNPPLFIVHREGAGKSSGVILVDARQRKTTWILPPVYRSIYFSQRDSVIVAETATMMTRYRVTSAFSLEKLSETPVDPDEPVLMVEVMDDDNGHANRPLESVRHTLTVADSINADGQSACSLIRLSSSKREDQKVMVMTGCDRIRIVPYPNGGSNRFFKNRISTEVNTWALLQKNGKYGAYFPGSDVIIPFQYDSIAPEIVPDNRCQTILIKAKRDGKWGLVRTDNEGVTEFRFDEIILDSDKFFGPSHKTCFHFSLGLIVKEGDRYNVLVGHGKFVHPSGFSLATRQGDLYGGITVYDGDKVGMYKDKILFIPSWKGRGSFGRVDMGKFPVIEILDVDKKLVGYADRKGLLYFRN
jgi:hypothetical protein